jgi:hypothetical protein
LSLDKPWIGFIIVNITIYIIGIQFLRQLKTYLFNRKINIELTQIDSEDKNKIG